MHFTCEKDQLIDAINISQRAVSSKAMIPALEGLLLETQDEKVKITAYDLELGIHSLCEANIYKKGSVILSARVFGDIIRKMPDGPVDIEMDSSFQVDITGGKVHFKISGMKAEEYPDLPRVEGDKEIIVSQKKLKSMIKQTIFCVALNDSKPALTGTKFEAEENLLRLVSVDGYRLAIREEQFENKESFSFIVPGKTLSEILKILKDDEDTPCKIIVTSKHIRFEMENYTVISRLLEGEFLNYKNAMPKTSEIFAKINTKDLVESVERAGLLINEKARSPVKLHFENREVSISCMTQLGKYQDELELECEGSSLEIGFNHRYLLDALKSCECERVCLELSTPLSPCILKPEEGQSFLFLVLPVRLKDGN